jgi:hypothetical protein
MSSRPVIGRRHALAGAGALLAAPAIVRADGQRGVALVIGNSKYQWESALPNVRRDAADVSKRFQALGLKTELVEDAGRDAMKRAFDAFQAACRGADFAAFYYAGHGAAWENRSYFVPIDADLSTPNTVQTLIPFSAMTAMREVRHKLAVYDSCRNNPADGWRQLQAERAAIVANLDAARGNLVRNALVLYSAASGRIALDGPAGQNSPFAAAFLRHLTDASVDLQSLPSRLRRDLLIATEGRQLLWDRNGYEAPFAIGGNPRPGPAATGGNPARIIELTNTYAYARENKLPLPSGLIAWRPAGQSRESWKAGAFRFETKTPAGVVPRLLVVLSSEGSNTAQVVYATRGVYNEQKGKMEEGSIWRLIDAKVSGNSLEFAPRVDDERFLFEWRDANAGNFTWIRYNVERSGAPRFAPSSPFTRLDG